MDTLIAVTALAQDLTLVTRNVRDAADTGTAFVNPWNRWF
jgi:predicted nucleic acid-binding protein